MLAWQDLIDELEGVERVAARFYFQGDGHLCSASLAWDKGSSIEARYLPLRHKHGENLDISTRDLKKFLKSHPFVVWGATKARDKLHKALSCDFNVVGDLTTAAVMMGILYDRDLHGLGTHLIGGKASGLEDRLRERDVEIQDFDAADPDLVDMAVRDARLVLDLERELRRQLEGVNNLRHYHQEIHLNRIVWEMERIGIRVSKSDIQTLRMANEATTSRLQAEVLSFLPPGVKLNSPKKLADALFNSPEEGGLGIAPKQVTSKGHRSTSKEALEDISGSHPVIPQLLDFKNHSSLQKVYEGLESSIQKDRIFPCWSSFSGGGGSIISSSSPCIKSLPPEALRALLPEHGYKWMGVRFPQAGLRFLAAAAEETYLFDLLESGKDIYEELALEWSVTRSQAKQLLYVVPSRFPKAEESTTIQRILETEDRNRIAEVLLRVYSTFPKLFSFLDPRTHPGRTHVFSYDGRYYHLGPQENAGALVACYTHQSPGSVLKDLILRIEATRSDRSDRGVFDKLLGYLPIGSTLLFQMPFPSPQEELEEGMADLLDFYLGKGRQLPYTIVEGSTVADCLA